MDNLDPTMRLKVKGDTFFLPDPSGGVYFRNNIGSFHIEGKGIDQWIEKLLPAFNGEHTLEDLTEGLPALYQERVYEIAKLLLRNGFVRNVSKDRPHKLADSIVKKYASQIEFINSFSDSGPYRFETYRQLKVLAIGNSHFFVSLVGSLLESGLPKLYILDNKQTNLNQKRIRQLAAHARQTDHEVEIINSTFPTERESSWQEAVKPFDAVLYVSEDGNTEELRIIEAACRKEKKLFIPAICLLQVGIAGPIVRADSDCGWDSLWRRLHEAAICKDPQIHTFSTTAGAMLANVIVFELLKTVAGVDGADPKQSFYLLNLETLEGNWHTFLPHPLENPLNHLLGTQFVNYARDSLLQNTENNTRNTLLPYFDKLTAEESGIFHTWEEGDLKQLPLALCRVQAVDPLCAGPSKLLPGIICSALTHEEARREAGLTGIEVYVLRLIELFMDPKHSIQFTQPLQSYFESAGIRLQEFVGVGAGQTTAEGVCRGLQKCLFDTFKKQSVHPLPPVCWVQISELEDERCQFYLQALTTGIGEPRIGFGEKVFGFPVVWIGTHDGWYGSVGLNEMLALRNVLQYVLVKQQIHTNGLQQKEQAAQVTQAMYIPSVYFNQRVMNDAETCSGETCSWKTSSDEVDILHHAIGILKQNGKEIRIVDLALEPFLKEELSGVYGVQLREEKST